MSMSEPRIHKDGTPEWYTESGEHYIQHVSDSRLATVRLYRYGDICWEWAGTVDEAEQIGLALLAASRYRESDD